MFGDQSWQSRYEEGHLGPLAVNERVFIRRNLARRAARYLAAMTFIDLGDCAVCQESIRDPCGSAPFLKIGPALGRPGGAAERAATGMSNRDRPSPQPQARPSRRAAEIHIVEVKFEPLVETQPVIRQRRGLHRQEYSVE